jgi:hypothetical protein
MKLGKSSIVGICLALYCLACWWVLEVRNRAEPVGLLQQYHQEYADGGSKKWRFSADEDDPSIALHSFITTFGLLVYPVAIGGLLGFGFHMKARRDIPLSVAVIVICSATLFRFIQLGVLSAALEF